MCLKESYFPDCWKVSFIVPVFNNVRERSKAKNYHPVSLLSVVSKIFKKLVNNRVVDYLIWAGTPSCYLALFSKLQKRVCRTVFAALASSLEPLAH